MLWIGLLLLLSASGLAGAFPVQVTGSTNVQALISYQSPVEAACTVEVSENRNFQPLVHDVDPGLYPGADLDSRSGNVSGGQSRLFIVGKRAVEKAADGKWYSRALQTDTLHYFRVRCGNQTAAGIFRTANIPVGVTYPWPLPQDPDTGETRWPTFQGGRDEAAVDPNYGTLIRRISLPGDYPSLKTGLKGFARATGTNWNNPAASLKDNDGQAATCAGDDCGWLAVTDPGISLTPYYLAGHAAESLLVRLKAASAGDTADDRVIEACLTIDGSNCYTPVRTAVLDKSTKSITLGADGDTWTEALWLHDISGNKNFGILVRPRSAAPVSVDSVQIELNLSEIPGHPDAGNFRVCSPLKSNGGYHCSVRGAGGADANVLYWINPETGQARSLGKIIARGWGGNNVQCLLNNVPWDSEDPNVLYCGAQDSNKLYLLKGRYRGNDQPAAAGAIADMEWINLTPGGNSVTDLVKAFDASFDPSMFTCRLNDVVNRYAVFSCLFRYQDSAAWIAVFDVGNGLPLGAGGTGRVVAATPSYAAPNTRWCGMHAIEPLDKNWVGWIPALIETSSAGGPFTVTLQTPLPASTTGRFTVQVSGEATPYLMDAQPGDVFRLPSSQGYDFLRIATKNSPTSWVVERLVTGTTAAVHQAGEQMYAFCNSRSLDQPYRSTVAYWDFLKDPYGRDSSGKTWVTEKVLAGAHTTQRGNYRIMAAYDIVTPGVPSSWNQPVTFSIDSNPTWAGQRVGLNSRILPNTYQSHPSYENYLATEPGRGNWFTDTLPFIGSSLQGSSVSSVSGLARVYKVNGTWLHRDVAPTVAHCGGRQLKDISPGPIGDGDVYTYCVGGGCVPGAAADGVFVNCPTANASSSCGGEANSVCVADLAPYGQSIMQFYLSEPDQRPPASGMRNRMLSNGLANWHSPRTWIGLNVATPLPDGSWILFTSYASNARRDLYMVKVPRQPEFPEIPDAYSRPVNVSVVVAPPAGGGVERAAIQYGGSLALGSTSAAQPCRSGSTCSFSVQARPLELLYAKPIYQDSAGRVLGEGNIQVQITTGISGNGISEKPGFRAENVVNGASFEPKLAPGAITTIQGRFLANCEESAAPPLPDTLCDSRVTFNGRPGRYLYASPDQLNVVLPSETQPGEDLQVVVERAGIQSDAVTIPGAAVQAVAPAIYAYALDDGVARAIIQNPDRTLNGPAGIAPGMRPLRIGETGVAYANALGPTEPPVADGDPAPGDRLAMTKTPVEVFVNGVTQPVIFAGLAPTMSAVFQVNFRLDPSTPIREAGENVVWLSVGGIESPRLAVSIEPASM